MTKKRFEEEKRDFKGALQGLARTLCGKISTCDGQWTIKGFIDVFKNVYTISADTKIVSKIFEIHLFPLLLEFARDLGFAIVPADHQNYYPDMSFVSLRNESLKFAVDFKTTYRMPKKPEFCNGFTLGSHGGYFKERDKKKNIQFPYNDYAAHFCLGIIYSRTAPDPLCVKKAYNVEQLRSIVSVVRDIEFFACEKWEIASDSQGSGNTANIGSITKITDILAGNGIFKDLGEKWFDDYWKNYGRIIVETDQGKPGKITRLADFLRYRGQALGQANNRRVRGGAKGGGDE